MTDRLVIRAALAEDQPAVDDLYRRASLANEGDRDALLKHPDALRFPPAGIEAGRVTVAERDGTILGFASVEMADDGSAEVVDLFVDPLHWRGGIGRRLLLACRDRAVEDGADVLTVVGNPASEGFYKACGFALVGTVETRFGPGLRMRCPTAPGDSSDVAGKRIG
jgi:N-acetylglutamate synthase-like GNAT family acetyltransferase